MSGLQTFWDDLLNKYSDPRTRNWPLMSSPFIIWTFSFASFGIIKNLLPWLMEKRDAINLRIPLVIYNALELSANVWLFYEFSAAGWLTGKYSYFCQPVDYSFSPDAVWLAEVVWWFFIVRITEILDTVFPIFRKNTSPISNSYVIMHHTLLPSCIWWMVKFVPGGHATFFCFCNSFVHVMLHTVHLLSSLKMKFHQPFKRYIFHLSIIEFTVVGLHAFQLFFYDDCDYAIFFAYFISALSVAFLYLTLKEAYMNYKKEIKEVEVQSNIQPTV